MDDSQHFTGSGYEVDPLEEYMHNLQDTHVDTPHKNFDSISVRSGTDSEVSTSEYEAAHDWQTQRHKKRKINISPGLKTYSESVQSTIKKAPTRRRLEVKKTVSKAKKFFAVVTCDDTETKLGLKNPILIKQKLFKKTVGIIKTLNKTKTGNLFVECFDVNQFNELKKLNKLGEWEIRVNIPKIMSTSVGCIYRTPSDISIDQVKEALEAYNVIKVEEMFFYDKVKKQKVLSATLKLYFNTPELPERVNLGFTSYKVKIFVKKPIQCFKCQGYGHMQNECSSKEICVRCGGAHTTPNCDKPPKCINCNGEHPASNKDCPKRIENIKIITKVAKEKCSYKEARTEVKHEIKKTRYSSPS
ncbi:Hypothetical predicted protein [Mytilus galloprovincialis]|uniref:CCHC-type domain-containing protein n=1 Tax=Mytilus galloprovincialis TaxID=29158 RepID=A0A8B6GQE3_MYTGA|nr:Hypothetical predicted protein [Mytilus galloprovincialis]